MKVDGLHHVTATIADIETNLDFYGLLLGLRSAGGRLVKLIGVEVPYTARATRCRRARSPSPSRRS